MQVLNTILTIILVLVSIALIVVILMQQGKDAGLGGGIAGASANTYISQNRGRTKEGKLEKWTKILIAAFIVLALAINIIAAHI